MRIQAILLPLALLTAACPAGPQPQPSAVVWISRFDDGRTRAETGAGWDVSTDARSGGRSVALMEPASPGAEGSAGALAVTGTVDAGLPYAWAGVSYSPGRERYAPADLSRRAELAFWARGDGGTYRVIVLSAAPDGREIRHERRFTATPEWTPVRVPFAELRGANLAAVRAINFSAGPRPGAFAFQLDQLQLR
jgi:hypothetical protein